MKFDTSDIDDDFDSEWDGTTVGDVVDDEATETGAAWTREPAIVLVDRWITEGVAAGMTHTAVMAAIRTTDPELHAEWRAAVMRGETLPEELQPVDRWRGRHRRKPRAAKNIPVAG
jgi:hypothetical protein